MSGVSISCIIAVALLAQYYIHNDMFVCLLLSNEMNTRKVFFFVGKVGGKVILIVPCSI